MIIIVSCENCLSQMRRVKKKPSKLKRKLFFYSSEFVIERKFRILKKKKKFRWIRSKSYISREFTFANGHHQHFSRVLTFAFLPKNAISRRFLPFEVYLVPEL